MSKKAISDTQPHAQTFESIIPGVSQNVAFSSSSAQSAAFQSSTSIIQLVATQVCFIKMGSNPTATSSDMYIPANTVVRVGVTAGQKLAVIRSSADGTLYITEGA